MPYLPPPDQPPAYEAAAPETRESVVEVRETGGMAEARERGADDARAEAKSRGLQGRGRLTTEAWRDGVYQAVYDFAGAPDPASKAADASSSEPTAKPDRQSPMPPPSWILVVPVQAGGGKSVWGMHTAWADAWVVPGRAGKSRLVATSGDADDRRRFPEADGGDPDGPGAPGHALSLALKYGAPAVAVVRDEGDAVSVWLWRRGFAAVSLAQDTGGDTAERKAASVALIGDIANGRGDADQGEASRPDATIPVGAGFSEPSQASTGATTCARRPGMTDVEVGYGNPTQPGPVTFKSGMAPDEGLHAARMTLRNLDGLFLDPFLSIPGEFSVNGEWKGGGLAELQRALCNHGVMPVVVKVTAMSEN